MLWTTLLLTVVASAQETPAPNAPLDPYRVNIQLREIAAGGAPTVRRYSLFTRSDGRGMVKTSNRVPVSTGAGANWTYFDVGVTVTCRLQAISGTLQLSTDVTVNDMTPMPALASGGIAPALTSTSQAESTTIVPPGKPTVILTWDDPQGKRRYEVEATVTRAP